MKIHTIIPTVLIKEAATIGSILNKASIGNFMNKVKTNPIIKRRNFAVETAEVTKSVAPNLIKDPLAPAADIQRAITNLTGSGVPLLKGTYGRRDFLKRLTLSMVSDPAARQAAKTTGTLAIKGPAQIANLLT